MKPEEIINELDYFINEEKLKYALLINGEWGSGKTFFINKYIEDHDNTNNKKHYLYVSLYGLKDIDELKNKFFTFLLSDGSKRKISGFLSLGLNVVSSLSKFNNDNTQKAIESALDLLSSYSTKIKDSVVFFDDLERCDLPINQTLGYINELVEHDGIKAILIANERILLDNNDYKEIKEKLIGKTINYESDIEDIYEEFAKGIVCDIALEDTINSNKEFCINHLKLNKHVNLRTLQFIMSNYKRLVELSIKYVDNRFKDSFLSNLYKDCVIKTEGFKNPKQLKNEDNESYFDLNYYSGSIYSFNYIDDFINGLHVDEELIKENITNYQKQIEQDNNNNTDVLSKLSRWWTIEEHELKPMIDELLDNVKNDKYYLGTYGQILQIISYLESSDVFINEAKEIVKLMINNINKGKKDEEYSEYHFLGSDEETGRIFKANEDKIIQAIQESNKKVNKKCINSLLNKDNWGEMFYSYIKKNESEYLNKRGYLEIIDVDKITDNIKQKNIANIYDFKYALDKMYGFSNVREYYENDYDVLKELYNTVKNIKQEDRIRQRAIDLVTCRLKEILNKLSD